MSTKFYLPSSGSSEISPNYSNFWDDILQSERNYCSTGKINSPMVEKFINLTSGTQKILSKQYISTKLDNQLISGTIRGQILGFEDFKSNNCYNCLSVYVVNHTGQFVSYLFTGQYLGSEYIDTTPKNRYFPPQSQLKTTNISGYNSGCYVVFECGIVGVGPYDNGASNIFGDSSISDLPINETTITENNPWIEFSQNLIFK